MSEQQQDLTQFIMQAVSTRTSEEAIRKLVEKNIDDIVGRSVESALRSFGSVGKQIEAAVEKAMQLPGDLDLPAYGHMVLSLVQARIDERLATLMQGQISEQLDELLRLAPPELTLSAVVKEMRSYRRDNFQFDQCPSFVVDVEDTQTSGSTFAWIKLHCEKRAQDSRYSMTTDRHYHEVRFLADTTKPNAIAALSIDKHDVKGIYRLGHMPSWKRMIFAAWCAKTPFIIDRTDFETEIDSFGED